MCKENGTVYIIKTESNKVKIGRSKTPEKRINVLRTQSGSEILESYISEVCSNYEKLELEMHKIFKTNRKIGEWFEIDFSKAVETLKGLKKEPPIFYTEGERLKKEKEMERLAIEMVTMNLEEEEVTFNFDKWKIEEEDINSLKKEIYGDMVKNAEMFKEIEEFEESAHYYDLANKLINPNKNLDEIKLLVQEFYEEIYLCVADWTDNFESVFGKKLKTIEKILGIEKKKVNKVREAMLKKAELSCLPEQKLLK